MNADLRHRVAERLRADGLEEKTVAGVVLSALHGRDALEECLGNGKKLGDIATAETPPSSSPRAKRS